MDEGKEILNKKKFMSSLKTTANEGKNKDDFAVQVKSFYYGNLVLHVYL
jgi:hypothetical protein